VPITADNLPDDLAALKRIITTMAQDALTAQAEIARLKFQLARYRRAEFGRSSEKLARDTEQLELALEALETDQAERLATASPEVAAIAETAAEAQKPARRPLPEHLPREDRRHPAPCTCPGCGGALRKIADEVSETLDYVPGRFKSLPSRKRGSSGTFAKNCRAEFATRWWRRRRRITRLPAAEPARGCSPISSCRNMTITCRSIARPRSLPATG
jgi:Transposase C of IS166 homeodomain/zinc-finger binding domain of transposase IS66